MELLLYVIFFFIWMIYSYKKNGINPFGLLVTIYFVSALCGFITVSLNKDYYLYTFDARAVIYNILLLFIFFFPLQKIFIFNIKKIKEPKISVTLKIAYICIIINISTMLYSLDYIYNLLMDYESNLGDVRNAFYTGDIGVGQKGFNFGDIGAAVSLFSLVPYFYLLNYNKFKGVRSLLFISSLNIIIQNLRAMSRDALMIWFFCFISLLIIFYPYINDIGKRNIKKILLFIPFIAVLFFAITISRSVVSNYDSLDFFLKYLGQPFVYLTVKTQNLLCIDASFYIMPNNVFGTFINSLHASYGIINTLLIAIFFCLTAYIYSYVRKNSIYIYIYILLYYFFSFGVLYMHYFFEGRSTLGSMLFFLVLVICITKIKINV